MLKRSSVTVDALCFSFDMATQTSLLTCATPYTCEGTPAQNPHDNTTATNSDSSLARTGAQDTQQNSADFTTTTPSTPRGLTL